VNELLSVVQTGGAVATLAVCLMLWKLDRRLLRVEILLSLMSRRGDDLPSSERRVE
jgi:hypothetical protein